MQTTAELRDAAYAAAEALKFKLAAELYKKAAEAYPPHNPKSQLAIRDLAYLRKQAKRYLISAED